MGHMALLLSWFRQKWSPGLPLLYLGEQCLAAYCSLSTQCSLTTVIPGLHQLCFPGATERAHSRLAPNSRSGTKGCTDSINTEILIAIIKSFELI